MSRRRIDPDALKVLYRLHRHGYIAYLVGGGVRDLLRGQRPKDYDVATDAHPKQIKKLFRNCFLVGRRFRLAHIRFGRHIIETSTFRRQPKEAESGDLLQTRDNTFGTPAEDACRRDFTINGLFYDIATFQVIDHVGGLTDLKKGVIRMIGPADRRMREDPVRMIRAIRFAARFGFTIEAKTYRAIVRHRRDIEKTPPARLLEELYRLFGHGTAEPAFRMLQKAKLFPILFPQLADYVDGVPAKDCLVWPCLSALDARAEADQTSPSLIFASLLYGPFRRCIEAASREGGGRERAVSHEDCARRLVCELSSEFLIPRGVAARVIRLLSVQRRFKEEPRSRGSRGRRFSKARFMEHESFPEALALYEISLAARGCDMSSARRWRHDFSAMGSGQRQRKTESGRERAPEARRGSPRRSSRRRRPRRRVDRDHRDV